MDRATGQAVHPTLDARRLSLAMLTLVAWILVTLLGGMLLRAGAGAAPMETVATDIGWNYLAAILVLAAATSAGRWRDLKFGPPCPPRSIRVLWFPALSLVLFAALAQMVGLPSGRMLVFLALNMALIGISEEWMFRGILFQALLTRFRLWSAIAISSLIFGAIHLLNVLHTGDSLGAASQAVTAAMSGVLLAVLVVSTSSIWPAILYHALWNFGILLVALANVGAVAAPEAQMPLSAYGLPVLLATPNFLYALHLLRKARNETSAGTG
jgi:uncharacterized protein